MGVAILAVIAYLSRAESTAQTGGLSLIQNPGHRVKAMVKALVQDSDTEEQVPKQPRAHHPEAVQGSSMIQSDAKSSGKATMAKAVVMEDPTLEEKPEAELLQHDEHDEDIDHEEKADHHAGEAIRSRQ